MAGIFEKLFPSKVKAREDIEDARKKGKAVTADMMDSTHQAALKALMKTPPANDTPTSPLEEEEKRRNKILGATKKK